MTGPSNPRGEHAPRPGVTWQTTETYVDNDPTDTSSRGDVFGPDLPRPNRATRRALARAARRTK